MLRLLNLQTLPLAAGGEWFVPPGATWFCGVAGGGAYLRSQPESWELAPGAVAEIPDGTKAMILASQLGPVTLRAFGVRADQLAGLVTLEELHRLEAACTGVCRPRVHRADTRVASLFSALPAHLHPLEARLAAAMVAGAAWVGDLPALPTAAAATALDRFEDLTRRLSVTDLIRRPLAELVAQCGCSERHFGRLFRQRFGRSFRDSQVEHRLRLARELLTDSPTRIIEVAYEAGFRHLGLFNVMFKRRFGLTPSAFRAGVAAKKQARRRAAKPGIPDRLAGTAAALALMAALALSWIAAPAIRAAEPAAAAGAPPPAGSATNAPRAAVTFPVRRYEVQGNSVLPPEALEAIFSTHLSETATYDTLRAALTELQLAYRGRGWVTASASLPPQQLTNGVVQVRVIEGQLTEIRVTGNRWFSSNNVMSALPSLRTNVLLNSGWFQTELDDANRSRDRQIYPLIGPGPDPGTSSLTLKVKDRLPLHGKLELNNKGTPGTPGLRMDGSLQYNNLWQREHQVGLQYNFTPEEMKPTERWQSGRFFDQPLNAAYSAFYRMPLSTGVPLLDQPDFVASNFGYDPVSRKFVPPPPIGRPELIFFASRSDSDTGLRLAPRLVVADTPLVRIESEASGEDLTINEGLGGRFQMNLPALGPVRQSLTFGPDLKHYALSSFNTNTFFSRTTLTNDNVPVVIDRIVPFGQPAFNRTVDYLPLSLGWNASWSDPWGSTSFGLNNSFNVVTLRDHDQRGTNAPVGFDPGHYYTLNLTLSRELRFHEEWTALIRAQGQWADRALISNEQFGLGGSQGVRGYREGEEYGDTGWRVLFEPRTPSIELGLVDGTSPMRARFSVFTDYGERYLLNPGSRAGTVRMWGAGFGATLSIGEHLEARASFGWALEDAVITKAGNQHIHFSVAAQF